MKRIIYLSLIIFFLYSCRTTDKKPINKDVYNLETDQVFLPLQESLESEDNPTKEEDLVTEESIRVYDLTVLKGGSYPKIKNDTPFTPIELEILQNESGIEIVATNEIAHYFKYFLRDKKELINKWIINSEKYIPEIRELFISNGLPVELIYLPFLESGYNTNAYSRAGAGGIWQFMPATARSYGLAVNWWTDERRSPFLTTPYAIKHLKRLYSIFGDWYLTLAAYNAGEGRISRAMEKSSSNDYESLIRSKTLSNETIKYVPQFIAIVKIMKNLEQLGLKPINWNIESNYTKTTIPGGVDLVEFSNSIDLKWSDFINLNPSFRRKVSDPNRDSTVLIPNKYYEKADQYLSTVNPITSNKLHYYTVKSGDSWWFLSKLTSTNILTLKRLNNINSNNLKIGQRLLLPKTELVTTQSNQYKKSNNKLQVHTVRSGDTISSISIYYNIKLNSLYKENNLNSYSILHIGQKIKLPGYELEEQKKSLDSDKYYTVKSGDSIWLIAQKTKIPYKKLLEINKLNSKSKLSIGDRILLY
ncbi:LysM peptidoglycan-binding domain-containing protein [Thiospirochaeta perfilievii]|uniref:LysM peptidoglycan-binding domain-containing protein n=1 Tax=Thiospirochaeta perfilievii TaxID=252967 RepID=A0A5C1Q6W5_9SPIO|nr:lytic transglycosylase domain-containing protein [Thiospirochaeta perfilievii]QEN03231.1 LysM peptidoglycan-binding domain-containing protein [Thiospirochaeta perfilievii]